MTLDDLHSATRTLPPELPLVFTTDDGPIGSGYHVTELKLAQIVSIDSGSRTSAWSETVLQLVDGEGRPHMPVGKFAGILAKSVRTVHGLGASPTFVEFEHYDAGIQIFRPNAPEITDGAVILRLDPVRRTASRRSKLRRHYAPVDAGSKSGSCCA